MEVVTKEIGFKKTIVNINADIFVLRTKTAPNS
jgi:hypothetical protein